MYAYIHTHNSVYSDNIKYRAVWAAYTFLLIEYRASLIKYRAVLVEYRALLVEYGALLGIKHEARLVQNIGFFLIEYRAPLI